MKKFVSILLALAMILAMSTTVFATEEGKVKLTITGATGHTYTLYQIFVGDVAKVDGKDVLSNVKYGAHYGTADAPVSEAVLKAIVESSDPGKMLAEELKESDIQQTPGTNETSVEFDNLTPGYYLIKDTSTTLPDGETKSPIMLQILENTTIASKHASIVSQKKVDDKNDSTTDEDAVVWQDVADYDIKDAVPFQLSVTLPSTLATYDNYELTFHDQQAAGFGTPTITKVYILAGTTETVLDADDYTVHTTCPDADCELDNCTFAVTVSNIEDLYTGKEDAQLIVEYTSVLTDAATVGKNGNENAMYVSHPDGNTPIDTVTVLTYRLTVNKIDGKTQAALAGAGFTLYKKVNNAWVKIGDEIKNVTAFTWSGIDAGEYKLEESTTPAGYNTIEPIEFTVEANHKTDWTSGNDAAFVSLTAKNADDETVFADGATVDGELVTDGILEGNVENRKGTVLPETGAEGTLLLITASALLVMVAAVFMITRKKMSIYED